MDKWLKDILADKDPYHNRRRNQIRSKGGCGRNPRFDSIFYNNAPVLKRTFACPRLKNDFPSFLSIAGTTTKIGCYVEQPKFNVEFATLKLRSGNNVENSNVVSTLNI
jgi:hypothetical protein